MTSAPPEGIPPRELPRWLPPLVLASLVALLFADVLFRGQALFERDVHFMVYGQLETFARCLRLGSWPTWDPFLGFGQPFLANPGAQVLYPWTWLSLLLRPIPAYTGYVVAHLAFAGLGLYLLGRRGGLSRHAALGGASVFVLSGPLLSLVSLWQHLAGAAWMPWVLLAADAALSRPTVVRTLLWGAAAACQILSGSVDVAAMTWLLLLVEGLRLVERPLVGRANGRRLASAAGAAAFALLLTAALWLPALALLRQSARAHLPETFRSYWSLHPWSLGQMLLPVFTRDLPLREDIQERVFEGREPFLSSIYLGLSALPLVAASLIGAGRARARWLACVGLAALVVGLGRHTVVYDWLLWAAPPLAILRYPSKAVIVAAVVWGLLAGHGIDALRSGDRRARRAASLVAVAAALTAVAAEGGLLLRGEDLGRHFLRADAPGPGFAALLAPAAGKVLIAAAASAGVALLLVARAGPTPRRFATAALMGAVLADLFHAHHDLNPTLPRAWLETPPEALAVFRADTLPRIYTFEYNARVLGKTYRRPSDEDAFDPRVDAGLTPLASRALALQAYLPAWVSSRWGLQGSFVPDALLLLPRPARNLNALLGASEETPAFTRLLRAAGVTHVFALHDEGLEDLLPVGRFAGRFAREIRVFRIPDPLPRTYAVDGVRVADGRESYGALLDPGFDPSREVVLPSGTPRAPSSAFVGRSELLEYRPDRVLIAAQLSHDAHVVLLDAFDAGWRARVDGREAPLLRANTAFRAVPVPAGRHLVALRYRPRPVVVGLLVSLATLLAAASLALIRHGRRR